MKRLAIALLLATPLLAQPHAFTFDDLASARRVGAPHVSPDGKWVAYDVSTIDMPANYRHSAIYLAPATGGPSRKITDGAKQDEGPVWSPNGKTIAFVSNRDGSAHQVYLYDVASGGTRKLSDLAGGASSVKWLPDGSGVVVVSDIYPDCGVDPSCIKQKDTAAAAQPTKAHIVTSLLYRHWTAWQEPTRSHIVLVPLSGSPRDLTPGAFDAPPFSVGGGDEFDVSPDSKQLVFARNTDEHPELSTNADLFIVPVAGGPIQRITTRSGADTSPRYSPDGKWIAYRSQARAGYESDQWELWVYNRATGEVSRVAGDFANWIESAEWAPDSKRLFITAPEKGREAIYEVTLEGRYYPIFTKGATSSLSVAPDGKSVFFGWSSLNHPAEIYSVSRTGEVTTITHENDDLIHNTIRGETSDLTWIGADGAQIQGFVVKPPNFDATKKYPALILIHGGPQGAWEDAWGYRWNPMPFASRGYVILMPNPRGSTGFGQQFVEQISGDWGGRAYTDIMNGVDKFASLPYVDGTRIGAAGASYGGYMIDWILGHTDRFKALVTHDGVYNLTSMYGATEELWFPEWELGGNPWDNPELYLKWSPNMFVKNFKTPTLVVHSELDYRVPVNQGLELFTALQRRGVPSKMLIFPDEGHWVLKPQNSKLWYQTVGDWLDQWVKK